MNSDDTRIRLALEATRVAYDKGHAFAVKQGSGPGEAHLMGLMTVANAIEQVLGEQTLKLQQAKTSVERANAAFEKLLADCQEMNDVDECVDLVRDALKAWKAVN
jgi:hypothetical protein